MVKCISQAYDIPINDTMNDDYHFTNLINICIDINNIDEKNIINIWHSITDGSMSNDKTGDPEYYRFYEISIFYRT